MPDGSHGPMLSFSKTQISDGQARDLYHYIVSEQGFLKNKTHSGIIQTKFRLT